MTMMFDGNMAVLVEYHNFYLSLMEQMMDSTYHWYVEEPESTSHFASYCSELGLKHICDKC